MSPDFCMNIIDFSKPDVWEKLSQGERPIVMYGTGNGADKVLNVLEEKCIKIQGVTASDTFVRQRFFRGFPVKPLSYFEELLGDFTLIITFGTQISEVMENIFNISKKHNTLVPVVPVVGDVIFDRAFALSHIEEITRAYECLTDSFSKNVYKNYVNFLYGGEIELLKAMETPEREVYENIFAFTDTETFVDIGAYRGDTVDKFLRLTAGKYKEIIAAEPQKKTYLKLLENCKNLKNFTPYNCAVTGIDGTVEFSSDSGRQSAVGYGKGIETESKTLPALCKNSVPTYIKIDAEGCERDILLSSGDIFKVHRPKLNLAAYHRVEDIFTLPLILKELNPDCEIYLRHHPYIPAWDTNFYCK